MVPGIQGSDNENYFNDLSRRPSHRSNGSDSPTERNDNQNEGAENGVPRPKRIACIICRKRKLKCDGTKPACGTCSRLGHKCAYDEVRRKSGPKRGYVKELEARLQQVETQLKSKARASLTSNTGSAAYINSGLSPMASQPGFQLNDMDMGIGLGDQSLMNGLFDVDGNSHSLSASPSLNKELPRDTIYITPNQSSSWEMIGLGLQEPLPPQETIDELHQIYFEKIHPSVPMMHKYRYLAAMNLAPNMRPAVCLRYAMWCLACSVTEKYFDLQDVFYQRARRYAENDEMKGHGEAFITVGHAQCWTLISTFEMKMMYFPRAWMSAGRATRLCQMMGLHRLDGTGLEVKQVLPPPKDWTDREERRRTFWMAYCGDRYVSIGTGWPMTIEEKDILTNLPATEEAYDQSKTQQTMPLTEAMTSEGASSLSSFAGVVLMACLFGRNLIHLHRPDPNDHPEDPAHGEFWKRHRYMDSILLNTSMYLPDHLRLPAGVRDANIVFLNMNIHTSTICLHQAAIMKAEKHGLDSDIIRQSSDRCFLAAGEIISIMRLVSHIDVANMNPFISFCLYVAARIYVQAFKKRSSDMPTRNSLDFLLNAMEAIRKKHALTESFLVQLMVDLEGSGMDNPLNNSRFSFTLKKDISADPCHILGLEENHASPNVPSAAQAAPGPSYVIGNNSSSHHYSKSTFSVPTREHRPPQQHARHFNAPPTQMQGVIPGQGWGEKFPTGPQQTSNRQIFDTEMSSDHTSDRQNSVSNLPTPTNSHQSSSNTSYSPHAEDSESTHPPATTEAFFEQGTSFPSFTQSTDPHFPSHSLGRGDTDNYVIPPGWDISPEGVVPSATTGLSPMGENGWTQMLEGMGWDGSALGAGEDGPDRLADGGEIERQNIAKASGGRGLGFLGIGGW